MLVYSIVRFCVYRGVYVSSQKQVSPQLPRPRFQDFSGFIEHNVMHIDTTAHCHCNAVINCCVQYISFSSLVTSLRTVSRSRLYKAIKLTRYQKIETVDHYIIVVLLKGLFLSPYQRGEGHIVFDADPVCVDMTHSLCALLCK